MKTALTSAVIVSSKETAVHAPATALQRLIWLYFWLLIVEGILRKWILPGFADPLLLVRDPVLLIIYVLALSQGLAVFNGYVIALLSIGICSVIISLAVDTGNVLVTAYGFEASFFHLPLIFVIANNMRRRDVIKIGNWCLILAVPMVFLMVQQFRASPASWINCGAGGSLGSQIDAGFGKIRPPGFFTFITGAAEFFALITAFLIYGLLTKKTYNTLLLYLCGIMIVLGTGVSTSRLTLGGIAIVFLMIGVIAIFNSSVITGAIKLLIPIGIAFLAATNLDVFHEGTTVFEARLANTGDYQAGALGTASNWSERTFSDFYGGIEAARNSPTIGMGLGVGTNVGARLLTGHLGFLAAEGEWARIILEMGPILGLAYLSVRIAILVKLIKVSISSVREGNFLPMLLVGACGLLIFSGQFRQGTTVGFAVLGAGLCLAATNLDDPMDRGEDGVESVAIPARVAGRSRYAERLHRGDRTDAL